MKQKHWYWVDETQTQYEEDKLTKQDIRVLKKYGFLAFHNGDTNQECDCELYGNIEMEEYTEPITREELVEKLNTGKLEFVRLSEDNNIEGRYEEEFPILIIFNGKPFDTISTLAQDWIGYMLIEINECGREL